MPLALVSINNRIGKGFSREHDAMSYITGFGLVWIAIHVLGIAATWLVRMQFGNRYEGLAQLGFLICLPTIAITTVVGYLFCMEMWPLSAITLCLMIVMAVFDLGESNSLHANIEL
jgi:hypothetical protein